MLRAAILCQILFACSAYAEDRGPGPKLNGWLREETGGRVQFQFEVRQRAEERTGVLFGADPDREVLYIRTRFGVLIQVRPWLKLATFVQDTRAPFYGVGAPGNVRDPLDLQQAYVEIFSAKQRGFGLTAGRLMINLGDTRLIGSPQWAYVARTWDTLRLYHVSGRARLELLFLSTGVPRGGGFNRPVLGDRIWGTYNTFEKVLGRHTVDAYFLRHDQNRPGGFLGEGRLGTNIFGSRWVLSLPDNWKLNLEGIGQSGHVGKQSHRASAFAAMAVRRTSAAHRPLDLMGEYKYASGTNPASGRSGTFDPLYPGVHDKFGHVDLLGWKNIHNLRGMATLQIQPRWSWILMYNNSWLASPFDAAYSTGGRPVARSVTGTAGRHIGQELDLYTNLRLGSITIGAGGGRFFAGPFIRRTRPGAASALLYLSTTYSF